MSDKNIQKISVRELCHIAIFAAIISVCAQVRVPMPAGVPMTLQTFAIPLAGVVLGRKNGTIAALVYILLGIAGVPVFAGFTGGIGMLFSKTGGFIISFPLMALTAGIGAKKNLVKFALWLTAGSLINYISGLLVFSMVHFGNLGAASLWASFAMAVAPFIPTAVIKIIMVLVSGRAIKRALRRNF